MTEKSPTKVVLPKGTQCFICNNRAPSAGRNAISFENTTLKHSGRLLQMVFSEMIGSNIPQKLQHLAVICKKCHKTCEDYDELNTRIQSIEHNTANLFKATCIANNLSLNDSPKLSSTSKIAPLPPNIVIVNKGKKLILTEKTEQNKLKKGNTFVIDDVKIAPNKEELDLDEDTIVLEEDENGSIMRVVHRGVEFKDKNISFNAENNQIELVTVSSEDEAESPKQTQDGSGTKSKSSLSDLISKVKKDYEEVEASTDIQSLVQFDGTKFICSICQNNATKSGSQKTFTGKNDVITEHLKKEHNARVFICNLCNVIFGRKFLLVKHMAEKHGGVYKKVHIQFVECSKCGKAFRSKKLLESHMQTHAQGAKRPYKCDQCGKAFSTKYTKATHMKIHMPRPRPFNCKLCSKSFLTESNLNSHERTHLNVKDFICHICQKGFTSQHNLEMHAQVHSGKKPYACDYCNKSFLRKPELTDHIRTHTGDRPFKCTICPSSFSQRSNLHSHIRATHFNERPHKCPHCEKTFKRRRLVAYHCKSTHTSERDYKCDICDATFVYPEHFRKHKLIHTGKKPFKCEVCGKQFNSRDNRNAHRFVHSDKKPYECLVCGAGFMRRPLLYAHMNLQNHVTDTIVMNRPKVGALKEKVAEAVTKTEDQSNEQEGYEQYILHSADDNIQDGVSWQLTEVNDEDEVKQQYMVANTEEVLLNMNDPLADDSLKTVDGQQILLTGANGEVLTTDGARGSLRLMSVQLASGENGWVAIKST